MWLNRVVNYIIPNTDGLSYRWRNNFLQTDKCLFLYIYIISKKTNNFYLQFITVHVKIRECL